MTGTLNWFCKVTWVLGIWWEFSFPLSGLIMYQESVDDTLILTGDDRSQCYTNLMHAHWRFSFWQKGPLPKIAPPKGPCQYHSIRTILSNEPRHPLIQKKKKNHFSLYWLERCFTGNMHLVFSVFHWFLVCISVKKN